MIQDCRLSGERTKLPQAIDTGGLISQSVVCATPIGLQNVDGGQLIDLMSLSKALTSSCEGPSRRGSKYSARIQSVTSERGG